jgi:hypothetical protein
MLSLAACTSLAERKRSVTLQDATFSYAVAMRWGDFQRADLYRRLDDPAHYSPPPEALQHIKITAYQVSESTVSAASDSAELDVVIDFYSDDSMTVTRLHDHQHWSYDADLGAWYITTPLPDFLATR